jgi:dihydroflavonol-4-reductase
MIMVTGGTGFAGSYILYELLRKNDKLVRAIKRQSASSSQTAFIFEHLAKMEGVPNPFSRIQWVEADLNDEAMLIEALKDVDEVYHCAAMVSFKPDSRDELMKTNVEGTARIVNLCLEKEVKKFGYVSSVAALSRNENGIIDETMPSVEPSFSSQYSKSKFFAEQEVWRGIAEGLPAVIVNPGVILGWGDFDKGSAQIFSAVKKGLPFYPPGSNGYVDARDVATALVRLMDDPTCFGKRYLLVSETVTYQSLFQNISQCLDVKPPSRPAGKALSYAYWAFSEIYSLLTRNPPMLTKEMLETSFKTYNYDNNRIRQALGFEFIPLSKTIADTCAIIKED